MFFGKTHFLRVCSLICIILFFITVPGWSFSRNLEDIVVNSYSYDYLFKNGSLPAVARQDVLTTFFSGLDAWVKQGIEYNALFKGIIRDFLLEKAGKKDEFEQYYQQLVRMKGSSSIDITTLPQWDKRRMACYRFT